MSDRRERRQGRLGPLAAAVVLVALLVGWLVLAPRVINEPTMASDGRATAERRARSDAIALARSAAPVPAGSDTLGSSLGAGALATDCPFTAIDESDTEAASLRDRRFEQSAAQALAGFVDALASGAGASDVDRAMAEAIRAADGDAMAQTRLVQLALQSPDVRVYGIAAMRCGRIGTEPGGQGGPCDLIDAAGWAQRDPGNAVPWLALAAQAQAQGDDALVDQAMFGVAHAQRSEHPGAEYLRLVEHPALRRLPPQAQVGVVTELIGFWAAAPSSGSSAPVSWCPPQLADANRRQACSEVAEMLVARGGSLADLVLGTSLGRRVGWPEERIAALADRQEAYEWLLTQDASPPSPFDCGWLARIAPRLAAMGRSGESAVAEGLLMRSGRSAQALAAVARSEAARLGESTSAQASAQTGAEPSAQAGADQNAQTSAPGAAESGPGSSATGAEAGAASGAGSGGLPPR